MKEEWKDCIEIPGYEISSHGRLRNKENGYILKGYVLDSGYKEYVLAEPKTHRSIHYKAHQLVASAFLGKRPKGMVIDHIDGTRTNHHYTNLRYVTIGENNSNSNKHIHRTPIVICVEGLNELYQEFTSIMDAKPILGQVATRSIIAPLIIKCKGIWVCKTYE